MRARAHACVCMSVDNGSDRCATPHMQQFQTKDKFELGMQMAEIGNMQEGVCNIVLDTDIPFMQSRSRAENMPRDGHCLVLSRPGLDPMTASVFAPPKSHIQQKKHCISITAMWIM